MASPSPCPSRTPPTRRRLGALIGLTSPTRPARTPMSVHLGARLTYRFTNSEGGRTLRSYWTDACGSFAIKSKCTTGKEIEAILERVQKRLDDRPDKIPL